MVAKFGSPPVANSVISAYERKLIENGHKYDSLIYDYEINKGYSGKGMIKKASFGFKYLIEHIYPKSCPLPNGMKWELAAALLRKRYRVIYRKLPVAERRSALRDHSFYSPLYMMLALDSEATLRLMRGSKAILERYSWLVEHYNHVIDWDIKQARRVKAKTGLINEDILSAQLMEVPEANRNHHTFYDQQKFPALGT